MLAMDGDLPDGTSATASARKLAMVEDAGIELGARPQLAGRTSTTCSDATCCYVCMDDDQGGNGLGAPRTRMCVCATAAIHLICLEKVLNSTKCRAKPLSERHLCTICHEPYNITLEPFVLSTEIWSPRIERFLHTKAGRDSLRWGLFALFLLHVTAFAVMLGEHQILITLMMVGGYIVVASIPVLILRRLHARRRARFEDMNDNAFYKRAVAYARREVRLGYRSSAEQVSAASSRSVILLVRDPAVGPRPGIRM
jgi:hypothetical protein